LKTCSAGRESVHQKARGRRAIDGSADVHLRLVRKCRQQH